MHDVAFDNKVSWLTALLKKQTVADTAYIVHALLFSVGQPSRTQTCSCEVLSNFCSELQLFHELTISHINLALTQVAPIAASCLLCWSYIRSVVVVVVYSCMLCCISYRLVLMLALPFTLCVLPFTLCVLPFTLCVLPFALCVLTFEPCACGVSLLSNGASIPLAQVVIVTSCNLRWWCFFIQLLAQILLLHSGNLHYIIILQSANIVRVAGGHV